MCVKRGACDIYTPFLDRRTVRRARLVKNDSILAMSLNLQVKQEQQDELPSKSSTPPLSMSSFNLMAPKRSNSFEDKVNDSVPSSTERPTPIKLVPRSTLRMRPSPFPFPQDETFFNDETSHQRQSLPRRASVDAFDHDESVFLTPRLHSPPSDFLSPPSVPKHDRHDDCIFVRYIPTELLLPGLP